MPRFPIALTALLTCAGLAIASPPTPATPLAPPTQEPPVITDQQQASVVAGHQDFAFRMLRQLAATDGNVVFSPYSLSIALSMTSAGARTQTLTELSSALGFPMPSPELDATFARINSRIAEAITTSGDRAITLRVANRIWADEGLPVLPTFAALTGQYYGAEVGRAKFTDSAKTADLVNAWIADQTKGLVPKLVEPANIVPGGMVLTNALYFKGRWNETFSERGTTNAPFTHSSGEVTHMPMMRQVERFAYAQTDNYQAINLGYEGSASMIVILPSPGKMNDVVAGLSSTSLSALTSGFSHREVNLSLPKFTVQSRQSVAQTLQTLGATLAFTDDADFSAMASDPLKIGDVLHGAKIIVDENGTEAAAATAVVMAPTSAAPSRDEPIVMKVDRPFIMIIRERTTGVLLFVAKVSDPRG